MAIIWRGPSYRGAAPAASQRLRHNFEKDNAVSASSPSEIEADCKQQPGVIVPVIDRNLCEGKAECVRVCPFHVFAIAVLPKGERAGLSLRGKLKGFAHGWRQAALVDAPSGHACGLCVAACPEKAISLARS